MFKPGCGPCDDARLSVLTPRERDVMSYVARGKANKVIAAELGVSQRTIEAHRARIFQKMKVRNAVELAHRLLGSDPYSTGSDPDARVSASVMGSDSDLPYVRVRQGRSQ